MRRSRSTSAHAKLNESAAQQQTVCRRTVVGMQATVEATQQPESATRISNQDQQQGSLTRFSNRRRAVSDSPRGRIEGRPGRAIPLVVHLIDQPLLVLADPILELLCGTHGGT